ncbi:MAG: glycosyltransferase family 2 protein [Flavobacteriia bacterium]|jgi:GT2 family glycosyltransferase|nr:glycosyltransferase family 2 protein [Flavobacteriia bacterium]
MKELAIVILNFNGREHLSTFLPSVIEHSENHAVVVVDNGSTDDSLTFLESEFPGVEQIRLNQNWGFAQGYNEGLNKLRGRFQHYLLLNSDVKVTAGYLSPMLERLKSENIAAVQPKILSYLEPAKFEHAGASGGFLDRNGFPFCRGRIFSDCEVDQGQYDKAVPVFWASGACLMVKSEVFHQMDGFDPFFFAHMEEIDLCWRMQHAGHQIWVEPKSKVYHLGGGTLGYESPRKTYLNFRNNLFMLVKNQGGFWPGRLFVRMAWDGIAAWQFLLKGRASLFYQVFKAHMALYYALPRLLKQRRNSVSSSIHGRPNINLIVQFFLLKKKTFQELP